MSAGGETEAPEGTVLLTFRSIHRVLQGERYCRESGIPYRLIPTPKEAVDDCGLGLCVERGRLTVIVGALGANPSHVLRDEGGRWVPLPFP